MALIKCRECGNGISTDAKTCPQCGARVKKPMGKAGKGLVVILILGVIGSMLTDNGTGSSPQAQKTPQQMAAEMAERAAEDKRITVAMALADGLKKSLRDPESLEFESMRVSKDAGVACAEYRARNGFGGMNKEFIVYAKGTVDNEAGAWNKQCTGMMFDYLHFVD